MKHPNVDNLALAKLKDNSIWLINPCWFIMLILIPLIQFYKICIFSAFTTKSPIIKKLISIKKTIGNSAHTNNNIISNNRQYAPNEDFSNTEPLLDKDIKITVG